MRPAAAHTPAAVHPAAAALAAWAPDVAVVLGSGLAALARHTSVEQRLPYAALGWPQTRVAGHDNTLLLARTRTAGGRELKLALACGRAHRYEGWSAVELARPAHDLAAAGVRRLLLTSACGGLGRIRPGTAVVCERVVDLQRPPRAASPPTLAVCAPAEAARLAAITAAAAANIAGDCDLPAPVPGTYVAVLGPQFETPAEVRWLAHHGDVVGMSAAAELRAAGDAGSSCLLLGLVVNEAGAAVTHDAVLTTAQAITGRLRSALTAIIAARWPELA